MPNYNFTEPQRQSGVGLVLIFATSLYHIARNLWVVVFYFAFKEVDQRTLLLAGAGFILILLISLGYSIKYFLNFKFHIDEKNEEFVLQKGVFSTDVINIPFQKIQQVNFRRNILQRVIGVYSVVVETAGSQDKEVEIKALSEERANALADLLMAHAEEERAVVQEEDTNLEVGEENKSSTSKVLPEWEHKVSLLTLIKLGLTSNYLRGVGIIIAFYFTLREQFMFNDELSAQLQEPQVYWAQGKFMLIIFLLIVGMVFTVGETVIKYFGLHLQKFRDTLQVEMGLRNNTKVNLRASRIQLLQVLTNPIQKAMRLYQVKISLASSENDLEKNQIKIVGLPPDVVSQVKEYFYKNRIQEEFTILPSKFLLLKKISRGLIPLLVVGGLLLYYVEMITVYWFLSISAAYLLLLVFYNFLYYRNLKLGVSKEFLIRYSGVWIKKEQYLEIFRLQAISVSQPIWYKRRGLVYLTFHSAGGDIQFPIVRKDEIQALKNYLLYKIESTEKHWM
ncbi:PH domain-containing protein [Salinimicrobium sediminilitoris]|uniref:PH domain-containing protein n=1 Tax=Salinimicrobium sediminilitoris TaxID=2876715 RepID=UPI001E2EDB6E|nr:PH domain-containing protein [Salinimicrobium sediminilitoris]MCC8358805.1 PH domain-containing protein [Salinimicrobium sediminilitoris]